jgi:hypothetical protein
MYNRNKYTRCSFVAWRNLTFFILKCNVLMKKSNGYFRLRSRNFCLFLRTKNKNTHTINEVTMTK